MHCYQLSTRTVHCSIFTVCDSPLFSPPISVMLVRQTISSREKRPLNDKTTPKWAWPRSRDRISKFLDPLTTFERMEISVSSRGDIIFTLICSLWVHNSENYTRELKQKSTFLASTFDRQPAWCTTTQSISRKMQSHLQQNDNDAWKRILVSQTQSS